MTSRNHFVYLTQPLTEKDKQALRALYDQSDEYLFEPFTAYPLASDSKVNDKQLPESITLSRSMVRFRGGFRVLFTDKPLTDNESTLFLTLKPHSDNNMRLSGRFGLFRMYRCASEFDINLALQSVKLQNLIKAQKIKGKVNLPPVDNKDGIGIFSKGIRGINLIDLLNSRLLSIYFFIELCIGIAEALKHQVHGNNIIHGNLIPENIMVEEYTNQTACAVTITNFIGSKASSDNDAMLLPVYQSSYTAPEVKNLQGTNAKSDIFSFGKIIELLLHKMTRTSPGAFITDPHRIYTETLIASMTSNEPANRPDLTTIITQLEALQLTLFINRNVIACERIAAVYQLTTIYRVALSKTVGFEGYYAILLKAVSTMKLNPDLFAIIKYKLKCPLLNNCNDANEAEKTIHNIHDEVKNNVDYLTTKLLEINALEHRFTQSGKPLDELILLKEKLIRLSDKHEKLEDESFDYLTYYLELMRCEKSKIIDAFLLLIVSGYTVEDDLHRNIRSLGL